MEIKFNFDSLKWYIKDDMKLDVILLGNIRNFVENNNNIDKFKEEFQNKGIFTDELWKMMDDLDANYGIVEEYCKYCYNEQSPELTNKQYLEWNEECYNCGNDIECVEFIDMSNYYNYDCNYCYNNTNVPEDVNDDIKCPKCGKMIEIEEDDI